MKLIKYFIIGIITVLKSPFILFKFFIIGLYTIFTIIPKYFLIGMKLLFKKNDNYNQQTKELEKKIIPIIILTLSITTYLLCIFIISRWYVQNERSKKFSNNLNFTTNTDINEETPDQYEDLTSEITEETPKKENIQTPNLDFINVNLNYYIQKNPETVAWIQVNGTNINYPIVQHKDNNYYLEHDFYRRKTINGWIYGDYRNDFATFNNNTIIYGHNLINRTMFGSLTYLLNNNWFNNKNNQYIKLSTKTTNSIWQIFSVYKIEPTTDYLQAKFNSTNNYQKFLETLKNRSIHKFDVQLNYTDKIITLSTCDDIGTKRIAIHAKLIKIANK